MPWFRAMLYFLALCWLHTEMSNLAKSSNGQKIARIAPISKIFCRNRPRRPELNFENILRAVLVVVVAVVVVGLAFAHATFRREPTLPNIRYVRTCVRACVRACVRTYVHTYVRTYVHTYLLTYVCTYVCTYIRTYVCMYEP